jgi:hypothetical protein
VSTRKLILLALACGLAILVAGSIQLFRITRTENRVEVLEPGDTGKVPGAEATVHSSAVDGDQVVVRVSLSTDELSGVDGGSFWILQRAKDSSQPQAADGLDVPSCVGSTVTAKQPLDCVLSFRSLDGDSYLAFRFGDRQVQWLIRAT